ncbi:MAG: class I SAM-dependent methyltransferase family protein [Hadesarchaea archaeon]|nr:class I SAM-dependent methyltransferase family protein [Hadesarchaea archaeon]
MGYLRNALRGSLSPEELELLPSGFDRMGHVAILTLPPALMHRSVEIAGALLQLKGVRTVALREGPITGRHRKPKVKVIAGEPNTETLHKEHGCLFKLDVAKVMFAPGNLFERGRIVGLVQPGEVVVDMFAGVGQFSIPIAKRAKPSKVYAIELNPVAYRYLCENIELNRVGHIVVPLHGDCEEMAPLGVADRVIMGILHVTHRYLPLAMQVLKPAGGIIHYHESVPSKLRFERPIKRIISATRRRVEILNKRVVKRYAPGVDHVVVDVRIGPLHDD